MNEPKKKRAVVFFDGQCLFMAIKEAFGYIYPNYNVKALAEKICLMKGWALTQVRFYTGIPDAQDDPFWNRFWINKLTYMGQIGINIFSRTLRYHNRSVKLPNGKTCSFLIGQEKGIDVRIALDVIRLAHQNIYDIALVFSQDQDLSEVADELRIIAAEQKRWINISSAFPVSPTYKNNRGINKTDWIRIDRIIYDSYLDPKDYR